MLQLLQTRVFVGNGRHLHLIECSCGFFTIAGNEGNGCAFFEQTYGLLHLFLAQVEALGYEQME